MTQNSRVMGVIGATTGTILGLIVWCMLGASGEISWIGGLALLAGAFFGYKLLGKDVDVIGMIVCTILVVISVYIGNRMTYAILLHQKFEDNSGFVVASEMLDLDTEASSFKIFADLDDYIDSYDDFLEKYGENAHFRKELNQNLTYGYISTAVAAVVLVLSFNKKSQARRGILK